MGRSYPREVRGVPDRCGRGFSRPEEETTTGKNHPQYPGRKPFASLRTGSPGLATLHSTGMESKFLTLFLKLSVIYGQIFGTQADDSIKQKSPVDLLLAIRNIYSKILITIHTCFS